MTEVVYKSRSVGLSSAIAAFKAAAAESGVSVAEVPVQTLETLREERRKEQAERIRIQSRRQFFTAEQWAWNTGVEARKAAKKARKKNG